MAVSVGMNPFMFTLSGTTNTDQSYFLLQLQYLNTYSTSW